jgi:predicted  nucleic acid-binding Zn-ribbon protein
MPGRGIYETVKQAIQDVVVPQLQELRGDIAGLRGEIVGLRGEIRQIEKRMEDGLASIRSEMNVRFAALDEKFTQRLDFTNKRLEEALEIRERLAALEARVASHS